MEQWRVDWWVRSSVEESGVPMVQYWVLLTAELKDWKTVESKAVKSAEYWVKNWVEWREMSWAGERENWMVHWREECSVPLTVG